jgi:hypothetical protein
MAEYSPVIHTNSHLITLSLFFAGLSVYRRTGQVRPSLKGTVVPGLPFQMFSSNWSNFMTKASIQGFFLGRV